MMLLGLRGVGKTVLLNRIHKIAESKGFEAAKIEAPEDGMLPQLLAPQLRLDSSAAPVDTCPSGPTTALRSNERSWFLPVPCSTGADSADYRPNAAVGEVHLVGLRRSLVSQSRKVVPKRHYSLL
jgi:hypothetical protein